MEPDRLASTAEADLGEESEWSQDDRHGADDLPAATVTDLGGRSWRPRPDSPIPHSDDAAPEDLQHALATRLVRSDVGNQEFLPNRELLRIVNFNAIQAELAKWQTQTTRIFKPTKGSKKALSIEARKICGNGDQSWRLHPEALEGPFPSPPPPVPETS